MPELPEVQTIADQVRRHIIGQRLTYAKVLDTKRLSILTKAWPVGSKVQDVCRLGKQIVVAFCDKDKQKPSTFVIIHLRMTGRLFWQGVKQAHTQSDVSKALQESRKYCRAELGFERGVLLFSDVRRFGTIEIKRGCVPAVPGMDPLAASFTVEWLIEELARSTQNIKSWLLRQDKINGIGNIYACEALFQASIHPKRRACDLSPSEVAHLRQALVSSLQKAIKLKGTTFSDFQDTHGESGGFQRLLKVYSRNGEPCRRCKQAVITRVNQSGRGTFFCPGCQH